MHFAFLGQRDWWRRYWRDWLWFVFWSWLAMEVLSIVVGHVLGLSNIMDYTLSDTIRRWSAARNWVAPVTVGVSAMLIWHWFAMKNPDQK